jgi:Fic family protein
LLEKAKNAIQFRKRKKLDKVMAMFLKQSKITNDEVEKFLHVSDATATRYLSQLEKENRIKQTGKTGHSVFYSKI